MPLPLATNLEWPPPPYRRVFEHMERWSAWYSGDTERLMYLFGGAIGPVGVFDHITSERRSGIIGRIARWFWGEPSQSTRSTKLHVPIAADLCQATADLLYSEPPTFTVEDPATQDRLTQLVGDSLHTVLAESAELGGALGGAYLKVVWDQMVQPDGPFITTADADSALPEFRYGRLWAVTFWSVCARDGGKVYRHLERHELDGNGNGVILHGLYAGTDAGLGRPVPLTDAAVTAPLAPLVDEMGAIVQDPTPGLSVFYVPNQRPQRTFRKDLVGRWMGRSVLDGVEHLMDALDETYSSWMRDIRLGKARIMVAESLVQNIGAGRGSAFDLDQEVYSPVKALPSRESSGLPIEQVQFAIRVAEHQQTAQQLVDDILRTAGFSAQTFGEDGDGVAATATEITARQQRSFLTRDRQIRLARPVLEAMGNKLLWIDQAVFGNAAALGDDGVSVQFADGVQESTLALAQTVQALSVAQAASIQTKVAMVHPDWDDAQVQDEVARIQAETNTPVPDPTTFGGGDTPDPSAPTPEDVMAVLNGSASASNA